MASFGFDYWLRFNSTQNYIFSSYTISLSIPSYVENYGNYSVKVLVITMDRTSLANQFPKWSFRALMTGTANSSNIHFGVLPNTSNPDSTIIFGLTDYYFYNHYEPSFKFKLSLSTSTAMFNFYGDINYASPANNYLRYGYAYFAYFDCTNTTYFIYN